MPDQTPTANIIHPTPAGYVEYEIDIERVLRSDLPTVLDRVPIAPLVEASVLAIPQGAKGAYVLFEGGRPVYAGKTDTRHGFRDRLRRHARTIQHRINLDPSEIGFKAIRILVFSNFDVEAILIGAMRKADPTALLWNASGFGSNDPGHRRETQEPAEFDKQRPIDIDRQLDIQTGDYPVLGVLVNLKDRLPYTFRFQTDLRHGTDKPQRYTIGHVDYRSAPSITLGEHDTVRSVLQTVLNVLPNGWRATAFPDRVILYKEPQTFPFARGVIAR